MVFQDGYGIESTFLSDPNKFARLITNYYDLDVAEQINIYSEIDNLINDFSINVKIVTNDIHKAWKTHFERQTKIRSGRVYKNLKPEDVLSNITPTTIQYIMTKEIMNTFLQDLHSAIVANYPTITKEALTSQSIFLYYYSWLTSLNDMFDSHKLILDKIYS